jgi:Ca2+-binding EF-hand superfamily protein
MAVPALLLALAAAAQAPQHQWHRGNRGAPAAGGDYLARHASRTFISPMGEPFRVGNSAEEGLAAWFQQADRNHDGSITVEEMQQDAQRFFLTLDTNHDGEIDPDETDHYENVVAPEVRSSMGWSASLNTNDEASGGGSLGLLNIPEPVTTADTNFDRGVSAAEMQQAATRRFRTLDTNGDGRLTLPELEAMRESVRANARKPVQSKEAPPPPQPVSDTSDPNYPGG